MKHFISRNKQKKEVYICLAYQCLFQKHLLNSLSLSYFNGEATVDDLAICSTHILSVVKKKKKIL